VLVTVLNDENKQAFAGYIPQKMFAELENPGVIALGAAAGVAPGEARIAAGVLIARIIENWLEITWLYTGEDFRRKSAGRSLVRKIKSCIKFAPELKGVYAQYPESFNGFHELFEQAGFDFEEKSAQSMYSLTVAQLAENHFWSRKPAGADNAIPLKDIDDVTLRKFEVALSLSDKAVALESDVKWREYDQNLSMAYINGNKISGILLIESEEGGIDLSYVHVESGEPSAMPAMIYNAGKAAIDSLSSETTVSLAAITPASTHLTEKLFPELTAIPSVTAVYRFNNKEVLK